jgi:predicted DNA binding CopG/RHH family protein
MRKSRKRMEAEVADYWLTHDSSAEIDWAAAPVRLEFDPDVERPTQPVTVRLPRRVLQELKVLAKDRDIPYQSLMKVLLAEKVTELRRKAG